MKEEKLVLPLIPLRGMTIFPGMVTHFDVGREKSIIAVKKAMKNDQMIFISAQKDINIEEPKNEDIYEIGVVCKIKQIVKLPDGIIRVLVEALYRAKIEENIRHDDITESKIKICDLEYDENDYELEALSRKLNDEFAKFLKITSGTAELLNGVSIEEDINKVTDLVASYIITSEKEKQEIISLLDIKARIIRLLEIMENEYEIVKIEKKVNRKLKKRIEKFQKESYLREQIKIIQEELGEDDDDKKQIEEYEEKINSMALPKEVKEKALKEVNRLKSSSHYSQESSLINNYLDILLDLPWNDKTKQNLDIKKAKKVLDEEHYGLEDVKERIIEYLAVKKMSNSLKGPILCLVGPPGVGKTSIAKSVANSINRNFIRMSLGGVRDEAEIRGHRRTYVGALPGRIVNGLRQAKTSNPLFLLDEIDKMSNDYKGDPADALLEVLDSEQNSTFRDHYLEVELDLSDVMFITTANSLDTIPRPLLDRMEVIEVSGYTYEEKFNIAKKYLLPKKLEEHGVKDNIITISDNALKVLIEGYTRESGVRNLERVIATVVRKAIKDIIEKNKDKISINLKMLEKYLGAPVFSYDKIDKEDKIGVVTGMAWTAYGGDTLPIEVAVMEGTGKLQLTGKLGDVMQESAKAAYTYVRANQGRFGIEGDFYKTKDVHIHVPEGAVPKDGPSAGVTLVTALVSALANIKVKHNVAMTGEITLTGKVLAIGGLKEKCLAAHRMGIDTLIIPKENEKDIVKIPKTIKSKLNIILAEKIEDVIKNALVGDENNENKNSRIYNISS